ncbi:hypothetical protein K505DRAFT_264713 [Melanomma pulvis-pyrius CBS 109.77]|uniref:Pentatricopeptide repeat protein-like protein n=1 Tax=Melanomma pulvis-pyrius CBS 109.77 TaxID=1314802 RepID=A0A6A6XUN3_9PLEO|nr:hypothetical protein K505DRAFT_264713 [Melanomma pulvis-pyrius CBS 109.77]
MLNCRACLWRCIDALDSPVSASVSRSLRLRRDVTSAFALGQQRFIRTDTPGIRKISQRPPTEVDTLSRSKDEPWRKSTQAAGLRRKEQKGLKRQPREIRNYTAGETQFGRSGSRNRDDRQSRGYGNGVGGGHSSGYGAKSSNERRSKAYGNKDADESTKPGVEVAERKLGRRDPTVSSIDWNRRRKELQYLSDPLELASFVKKELMKDKAAEMLQLVQMASHSMQAVVSWNHLIDYHLAKQRVSQAMKIYNEMKKRAQFPDSYTYTILLRGLSINAHESGALSKALSVYHSMFAPNARVEPSIMHTNAMLKVCSRTQDMDALWGVAAKIPESGPAAANTITYVTILNAIRQSLLVDVPLGETEEQVAARRERGIVEGRRIWQDVVRKWRNADLVIEEELVCAMGRLLLIGGRPRDWDDVLSLVEQTMDIPRLVPRLGTPQRTEAGYPHLRAPNVPEQHRLADDHLSPNKDAVRGDEFLALSPNGFGRAVSNPLTYATPSNNTLSMIQEACQKVIANKASGEYWDLLTDPTTYDVVPDINNLNFRLRLLRQNRASGEAVKILKESFLAKGLQPRPGTFRIAMSTCGRDKNNHNSLKNGSEILGIMSTCFEDVDSKVVSMYADLANSFPLAKGADLVDALTFLRPATQNLRIQLGVATAAETPGNYRSRRTSVVLEGSERQDAITALRKIYGLFDKLLHSELLPEDQKSPFKAERAKLSAYLHRLTFKDGGGMKWEGLKAKENEAEDGGEVAGEEGERAEKRGNRNLLGYFKGPGSWRERTVGLPADKRKPWFSPRVSDAA